MQTTLVSSSGLFPFPDFGFFGSALVSLILIAAWVILASSRLVQGGTVERPERVPQLYGYTVCLVTLIWSIMSVTSIIDAAMTLNAPLYRGERAFTPFEPSVSSFESFRTTYDMSRRMGSDARTPLDTVPEQELRRRYDALRVERIERNTAEARRSLITSTLALLVAAVLFTLHWRWLRGIGRAAGVPERIDI